jgi:hypothetical protein
MAEVDIIPPTIRVAAAKPKFGIYYALLIVALCALITSCVVLYLFIKDYGGFGAVKGKASIVKKLDVVV